MILSSLSSDLHSNLPFLGTATIDAAIVGVRFSRSQSKMKPSCVNNNGKLV